MIARRLRFLYAFCAFVATVVLAGVITFASGQVQIVRHWSLYAASGPGQPYHLYLEPFLDARTCDIYGAKIASVGGRAYCGSKLVLSFDRKRESQLFWELIASPWTRICGPGGAPG
ncbi:MAG TPA: hypothetical protein VMG98_12515 [Verrucomicrobiae bacterium]|nr:hypothetical protein [Verrucomicrobiae bacterium]